jgi:hypothetical protein
MFSIGDIIYSTTYKASNNNHYSFAIIEKVTRSGNFRIRYIGSIYTKKYIPYNNKTMTQWTVTPNIERKMLSTERISSDGYGELIGYYRVKYIKYNPSIELVDNFHKEYYAQNEINISS